MSSIDSRNDYQNSAHFRLRLLKDKIAKSAVGFGGISVIIAISLIFIYLLYVVLPMLQSPSVSAVADYELDSSTATLHMALDEQAEVGSILRKDGVMTFFNSIDGSTIEKVNLAIPEGVSITSFASANPLTGVHAVGLSDGRILVFKQAYKVTFPNDKRLITPLLEYPLGDVPLILDPENRPIIELSVQAAEDTSVVGWMGGDKLLLAKAVSEESFLGDETEVTLERYEMNIVMPDIHSLLLGTDNRNLYLLGKQGDFAWYDMSDFESPVQLQKTRMLSEGVKVVNGKLLAGGSSLMLLDSAGTMSQWFAVRGESGKSEFQRIREFDTGSTTYLLTPEYSRKGILTADSNGQISVFHTTSNQLLIEQKVSSLPITHLAISPRADAMLVLDADDKMHFWEVNNQHPEVSWSSIWSKVWYEGYDKPAYIWQSSASNNDFEPKLSLIPLTFGTLKAAFYAMLFAIPLAILGAIYTAYFMTPVMRRYVKPTVEIMEALPTVILGFLAGLWLAPYMESHLPGIFTFLILMPTGIFLAAFIWQRFPESVRQAVPDGWEAALLMPVLVAITLVSFGISPAIELWLFDGNMPGWLTNTLGIDFDQRNSLVVGLAMGFAVVPTIFSIAEDAIFSVPRHLTNGSLALGATTWQTLVRVVLLTASPGIFSAVMMGVGRAVGETMIVLMATGNTPVMDLSIFQGMRTLSANIAVEMPESAVGSTHYRVLFLAALVLFGFTFLFNTGAEIVRQRLRKQYSSL